MKQTEIGLIPDDWEVKSLGGVAEIKTGPFGSALHASDYVTIGTPIITVEHIGTISIRKDIDIPMVSAIDKERLKSYSLITGDLIFSRVGAVDRNCVVSEKESGWLFSGRLLRVRLNKSVIPLYMSYHLSMKDSKDRILAVAVGLAMPSINTKILSGLKIVLPPIVEQQRIAKALSDVDALISTTEKLIQKKKNIKQGTMQNLLTGKKRLPGFAKTTNYKQSELGPIPEDWEVKTLGELFSIKHGYGFEGQFFSSENNQHIVVTPGNFKLEGGFQKQKQPIYYTGTYPDEFKLKPNDLIIMMTDLSKNSDTLGNPAIVPDDGNDYLHNQRIGLIQIHNDSFVKDYIYLLLCTKEYHEAVVATAAGSTVKHTSPKRIYSIKLVVSTSKEEQTAIANVLSSMDKEIETLNTKLEKYRNLKTAMMQQLLTGKIRLV